MRLLKNFISGFIERSGNYVLLSTVLSRALSFIASWVVLQLLDSKELGIILFAFSIILFIIPISGLGLHQSLIRFGALLKTEAEKEKLFSYVLKKGTYVSILIILLLLIIGYFIPFQFERTYFYFTVLSFSILSHFFLEVIKIQFRLQHKNHFFAKTEIGYNVILLILVFILSYYFKGVGYAIALVLSPFITSLIFFKRLNLKLYFKVDLKITDLSFWKYGFFGGLSNVATQLLFLIDIILIGYLSSNPEMVTYYRYISIIPFSILFLPRAIIATDFVSFTEKIWNKDFIISYQKSYLLILGSISLLLILISFLFSERILTLFGENYKQFTTSFNILILGITGVFTLRGLYGNLLSSIGRVDVNYYIISIALVLNIVSNYYLIPKYGIKGAAITSAVLMWFTGILSWLCFHTLYKQQLKENNS